METADQNEHIHISELFLTPAKFEDDRVDVQDPLEEVNLGGINGSKTSYISQLLLANFKALLMNLLRQYQDCFAWDYHEMPGLDRSLVEHRLPIKPGFRSYKQPPRRMANEIILKVKEEVERLLKARFIRQQGMQNGFLIQFQS